MLRVIFLFFILIFPGCNKEKDFLGSKNSLEIDKKLLPEESLQQFTFLKTKEGKKIWQLVAEHADIFEEQNKTWIKNLSIIFYKDEKKQSRLSAQEGWLNKDNVEVEGNVVVISDLNGMRLETEKLYWSAEKEIIYTEQPVKIIEQDRIVSGVGLEATPDLETIKIKQQRVEMKR